MLANPIRVSQMQDGVVDKDVYGRYVNEIVHFIGWVYTNKPMWMTEFGKTQYENINIVLREGEKTRAKQKRIKEAWMTLTREAPTNPYVYINQFTPAGLMEYISSQAHQRSGKPLSKSGYSGKRSALKHLAHCHLGQS